MALNIILEIPFKDKIIRLYSLFHGIVLYLLLNRYLTGYLLLNQTESFWLNIMQSTKVKKRI